MDLAYDHIQGEIFAASQPAKKEDNKESGATQEGDSNNAGAGAADDRPTVDLNTELQETFRAFSASPWGVRIGGLWDNVRKQGESYYEGARQEYAAASEEAVKGFSDLKENIVGRTRGLSLNTAFAGGDGAEGSSSGAGAGAGAGAAKDEASTPTGTGAEGEGSASGEGFLARLKAEAARRLKEIEKAEEAADEAILRFGMNIGQKLRDAVSIVPPDSEADKLLFESKDADGKRVIHATRFEAQLHVIHSNLESFTKDPVSDEWAAFKEKFDIDSKTDDVAADLEKYPELRSAMEKLVPEQVEYATFWCRYYFLRLVIETEEQKRKELLKGMSPFFSSFQSFISISILLLYLKWNQSDRHRRQRRRRRRSRLGRRFRRRHRLSLHPPSQDQQGRRCPNHRWPRRRKDHSQVQGTPPVQRPAIIRRQRIQLRPRQRSHQPHARQSEGKVQGRRKRRRLGVSRERKVTSGFWNTVYVYRYF